MNAIILSVGTELVVGQCVDTNSAWLSAELTRYGVHVLRHVTVSDEVAPIEAAVRSAMAETELVIITGGLGPTADDVTRQAVAAAFDEPLVENPEALAQLCSFFERWQRPMPDSNRLQALAPRGGQVLQNRGGTAPGIGISRDGCHLFALPGVPGEMKSMFDEWVRPIVRHFSGPATSCERRLLCFGVSEAKLGETLADLMSRGRNPLVGTTASEAVLSVRIVAFGDDEKMAGRLVEADVREIRGRLGAVVFGEGTDTLESVVGRMLTEQGLTLATAESCTGGLLGARLTDVAGSSAYFRRGYVTYSDDSKVQMLGVSSASLEQCGAVCDDVAGAMADCCRKNSQTDYGLAITGIAGPSGGTPDKPVGLVYIGLADELGVEVKRVLFGVHLTRQEIRDRSCKTALNILRLKLLNGKAIDNAPR